MGTHPTRCFFGGRWMGRHSFLKKKVQGFFVKAPKKPPQLKHEIRFHHNVMLPTWRPRWKISGNPKIHLPRSSKGLFPTKNVITWKSTNRIALLHQPLKPMQNKKKSQPPKVFDRVVKHHHSRIIRGPGLFRTFPGFFITVIEK